MKELLSSLGFLAALLCLSLHPSITSGCPPDATMAVTTNVVEDNGVGTSAGYLVRDYNAAYHGGVQYPVVSIVYPDDSKKRIFEQFFEWSDDESILNTKGWIDREQIAMRLMDTYSPVTFDFDMFFYDDSLNTVLCLNVTVRVLDLDDNTPNFSPTVLEVMFEDNNFEVGNERVLPHPEDHDEGVNGTTIYELIDNSGMFGLEFRNYSGTTRVESLSLKNNFPLDHEETESYQLQLRVKEGNADPDSAVLTINVTVADVCDEPTSFSTSRYTPSIREDATRSTEVATVGAADGDDSEVCPLRYSITRVCGRRTVGVDQSCNNIVMQELFNLDSESGTLTLIGDLDRETVAEYEVNVQATDMQSSATAVIVVTVEDVNDNCPTIDSVVILSEIPEHQMVDPGTAIGRFVVQDADAGRNAQVSVKLLDNSTGVPLVSQTFGLATDNNIDYRIFLNRSLDYESQTEFNLIIDAHDNGTQPCFKNRTVTIAITDYNDHPPVFDPIEPPTISENSVMNSLVVGITATDRDSGSNAAVTFDLPENSDEYPHQYLFTIDNSGNILVGEHALDYETNKNYTLLVRAWNSEAMNPQEAQTEVVIYLENVNDNPPDIVVPLIEVKENHTVGLPVGRIEATDIDNLADLTYSLVPDSNSLFSIASSTGIITLEGPLDYEDTISHVVTVMVSDGDHPEMADITINVLPVNDEEPVFISHSFMGNVEEEMEPGTLVTTVTATDRDIPQQTLNYVIRQGAHMERFSINSQGQIHTTEKLDREGTPNYTLWVQATDGQLNSSLIPVSIQVLDINDHPPEFINLPYNFEIVENTLQNPTVGTVSAMSLDEGVNQEVRFEISAGNSNGWFSIDEHTGQITANRPFDHETDESPLEFEVTARDLGEQPLSSIVTVTVTITDFNDNEPVFPQTVYYFTVQEDFPTGQVFGQVEATDADGDGFNIIRYSFSDQTDTSGFFIKPSTGELSLITSLDFETTNLTMFDVIATDDDRGDFQTSTTVVITITNARDLNLTFPANYSPHFSVVENTAVNHTITTVQVTDTMNNPVSRLIYTLTTNNDEPSPYFGIRKEDDTAYIYTRTHMINREAEDLGDDRTYRLILNVSDPDTTPDSYGYIVSYITIEVLDVNDNDPRFILNNQNPVFSVMENGDAGEEVGSFEVVDPDGGNNGTIHLSITSIVPFNVTHVKRNNGQQFAEIKVVTPLDREIVATYEFLLQASDQGNPSRVTTMQVVVHVLDENDNPPRFCDNPPPNENCMFTFPVAENQEIQQVIATVQATDLDDGTNAEIRYEFVPGELAGSRFTIDTGTGSITLSQSLDLEQLQTNEISFDVRAVDGGNKASTATVIIQVQDYNDYYPVFINSSFTTIIDENHPTGVPFTSLLATDQDIAPNSIVRYALADYSLSRIFEVNKETGGISIKNKMSSSPCDTIDYERKNEYKVGIIAYDSGSPPKYSNRTLTVQINDVNEHTPRFDVGDVHILMNESAQVGTRVLEIQAYDKDYADSLEYTLSPPDSPFSWSSEDSALVLNRRESIAPNSLITAQLRVSDGRDHSSINIVVFVLNENDHRPMFSTGDTTITISENTEPRSRIFAVHASDADNATNDAIVYSITQGNTDDAFYINPQSGVIYVAKDLDYETEESYTLTVLATDTGEPAKTSTPLYITVDIINENDELPVFEETAYTFTLVENNDVMALIGCVLANDADEGSFGDTLYSIIDEGGNPGLFSINIDTGCISALYTIDRETDSEFQLTVRAQDKAEPTNTDTVRVTVQIGDINDNGPSFDQPTFLFPITLDYSVNQVLGSIEASDPDSAENALFTYEIVSQNPNIISLSQDGEVRLATEIPAEYESSYSIEVRVTSNVEGDDRSSDATVLVIVESDSAHHPQFTQQIYEEHVSESASTGYTVFRVSDVVSDQDGSSGLTYSLADDHDQFALDSETGLLTLEAHLNYEEVTRYELQIRATDSTSRTATATLIINVEDGNDHAPVFISPPSEFVLSPIPYKDIQLFSVMAEDDDIGSQGTVGYSIVGPSSDTFEIDSEGVVTNKENLNTNGTYVFVIRAFDHGSPLMSSNITVHIRVDDTSNPPRFSNGDSTIDIPVPEDKDSQTDPIIQGFSTQPEADSYHLVYSNASKDMFSIDMSNRLVLNSQLDYETASQYLLIIEARSISNGIRLSSFLMVNIKVTDVNDNAPHFSDHPVEQISELESPDTELFTVEASDYDSGTNAEITYAITGGNSEDAFRIEPTSGIVTLIKTLDRERTPRYNLVIRATDGGDPAKQNETTILVEITDVNDNSPIFSQSNYSISVYEAPHSHIGDSIILIEAKDADTDSLSYYIQLLQGSQAGAQRPVSSDTFSIDFDTGNITLHRNLDREEIDRYFIRVEARDADEMHTAVAYLTVTVLDTNDHTPAFVTGNREVVVDELTPENTLILDRQQVTDRDIGQNSLVKYSLGEGWPEGYFKIHPWTGVLRTARSFPFDEEMSEFTGKLRVVDQGVPPRSSEMNVRVTIRDVNNHPPVLDDTHFHFEISVDHPTAEAITEFNYSDEADVTFNTVTMLRIPEYYSVANNLFKMEPPDGNPVMLKLHGDLQQSDVGEHQFRIEAIQQSSVPLCAQYIQATYAFVTVIVHPTNDNNPVFDNPQVTHQVLENAVIGQKIEISGLFATDADGNSITYKILTENVPFEISDPTGPVITVIGSLDADSPTSASYTLTVQASDDGFPVRSSDATLVINVEDVNDLAPEFPSESYVGVVTENSDVGILVLTVSAVDRDSATLRYSIEYPTDCNSNCFPFQIEPSGEIVTVSDVDFELRESYSFHVAASDTVHTTTVPVTIDVKGENEYKPTFEVKLFEFTVSAGQSLVGRLRAVDQDGGNEGKLHFSFNDEIDEMYDVMTLNETTGDIFLPEKLPSVASRRKRDVEYVGDLVILRRSVKVQDSGDTVQSDTAEIAVSFDRTYFEQLVGATSPAPPTRTGGQSYEIIIIVVLAVVVVIVMCLSVLVIAYLCRRHKNRKFKVEDAQLNSSSRGGSEMTERYCRNENGTSLDSKTVETSKIQTGNSASGSERSYTGTADDEMDSGNERYPGHSPNLTGKPLQNGSPRVRSTSDLASSVGTDALHSQANEHPYTKAQLMRIYAANEGLLDDNISHDSVHMFGSEGGGEADGDLDINNLILQKIHDLEDDEESTTIMDDDASTTYSKGRGPTLTGSVGNLMPPEDREDPLNYSNTAKGWIPPTGRPIDETIDEITAASSFASQEEPLPRRHGYDLGPYSHSQGASLYNPSATQESFIGIQQPPKFYKDSKMHDFPRRYYHPEEHHERLPRERERERERPRYPMPSHRYGSASVLPDYHHHHHHHPHRVPAHRPHYRSQDLGLPYTKYSPYTPGARRPHPNTYMTPTEGTDGTVTPQTALTGDYHYLSSSSTSLTSTNVSANLSQPSRLPQMYH